MSMTNKERMLMGKIGREWMIKDFSHNSIGIRMHSVYKKILKKFLKINNYRIKCVHHTWN